MPVQNPFSLTINQNVAQWDNVNLGAPSTWGTAPAGVVVIGTNAELFSGINALTANSTTTSAKFGLDMNVLSVLGTAPTTAGKLDVKGADGDVFVRNATAANLLCTAGLDGTKTAGGMGLPFSASLTATKAQVKGTAGQIYGWTIVNNGSALCYVQVFNKASASVTVGTTVADFVIPIPAPASGTNGAGIAQTFDLGIAMGTGITLACTTTRGGLTTATCDVLFFFN